MQTAELSSRLREWSREFASLTEEPFTVPERFWPFVAQRLEEAGIGEPDPDVLSVQISGVYRKVRVLQKVGGRLRCAPADGSIGWLLVDPKSIHPADRGRLTDIIQRMIADGRIAE